MDSGDEDFKINCLGTMVAVFIEIEKKKKTFMTLPCWERLWSLGGQGRMLSGKGAQQPGYEDWRFDPFSQLDTGDGQG